jgi:hypothetical protein
LQLGALLQPLYTHDVYVVGGRPSPHSSSVSLARTELVHPAFDPKSVQSCCVKLAPHALQRPLMPPPPQPVTATAATHNIHVFTRRF